MESLVWAFLLRSMTIWGKWFQSSKISIEESTSKWDYGWWLTECQIWGNLPLWTNLDLSLIWRTKDQLPKLLLQFAPPKGPKVSKFSKTLWCLWWTLQVYQSPVLSQYSLASNSPWSEWLKTKSWIKCCFWNTWCKFSRKTETKSIGKILEFRSL